MNLTLRLLLGACSVIAWLNISNDAWDYQTGVDSGNRKPESIVNLLNGDVKAAHVTSAFFLIAGVVTLLPLFANAPAVAPMALLLAIGCGYAYQAPPLRVSYKGLGEPLCFTAFGPLATSAFFAVFAGANLPSFLNVPPLLWVNAWMVGVTTSMILFASHLHQREGDEREVVAVRSIRRGFLRQLDSTRRFRLLRLDRDVRLVRMVTFRCRSDDFYHLPISESDAKLRVG